MPRELAEALAVDLTKRPSLWEWSMTDSGWYRELVTVWNAYQGERRAATEAQQKQEELRREYQGR